MSKSKSKKKKKKGWMTAASSDPHILYELSVQDSEAEVEFIDQVWKEIRGRLATTFREDFCGTAISSCEWVQLRDNNTATGVDINAEVLKWAKEHIPDRLNTEQQQRLTLVQEDVLKVSMQPVETVVAMNFSYYMFKTREQMKKYYKRVYESLTDDGLFVLDAYGGSESFEEMEEERDCDGFTYVWDQNHYNPITGKVVNHIHFRFPDGTEIKKAFSYDWRLWTLPEIQELLLESGFAKATVYWEGTDEETEEGDGEFTATTEGEACEGWIAYIVAEK